MKCVKCGNENSPNAKFCCGCGNKLEGIEQVTIGSSNKCSKCGHVNESSKKFCPKCGAPVVAGVPIPDTSVHVTSPSTAPVPNHTAVQPTEVKVDYRKLILGVVVVVVALLFTIIGYWYYQTQESQKVLQVQEPVPATPPQANTTPETISTPPPAPEIPSINITKAVVAAGVDTNNVPLGIDTNFYSGNKRLFYYISYNGAIANSTVFVFKWYQYGNQIKEEQFTPQYASGNVWNSVDYDFQPGQYEAKLYANGQLLNSTSFNVIENNPDIQRKIIPPAKKVENHITPHDLIISPLKGQSEQQQSRDYYDCYGWAVDQIGYDPSNDKTHQSPKYNDYHRAICACLEGRGYTAK